jgi:hypothetical protein
MKCFYYGLSVKQGAERVTDNDGHYINLPLNNLIKIFIREVLYKTVTVRHPDGIPPARRLKAKGQNSAAGVYFSPAWVKSFRAKRKGDFYHEYFIQIVWGKTP